MKFLMENIIYCVMTFEVCILSGCKIQPGFFYKILTNLLIIFLCHFEFRKKYQSFHLVNWWSQIISMLKMRFLPKYYLVVILCCCLTEFWPATYIHLGTGHNWTYIRLSEDVLWTSYVRSIYNFCSGRKTGRERQKEKETERQAVVSVYIAIV